MSVATTRRTPTGMESGAPKPEFSIRAARKLLKDEFVRKPGIYWADMLLTVAVAYSAAFVYMQAATWWLKAAAFFMAGFALFRAGTFIHEVAHMGQGVMKVFRVTWDLCCGIVMLMPSFTYDCHVDHHTVPHYGTDKDGEYLPLAKGPLMIVLIYMLSALVVPLFAIVRFLILGPISFLHPKLRQWTLERASSYVMNPWYRRTLPANAPRKLWAAIDIACFFRSLAIVLAVFLGIKHWTHWLDLYALAVFVIGLNWTRNVVAHHYRNQDAQRELSHEEQLTDSINITGGPILTELLFPLGLRYHALHHLFAGIPYHSLGRAHRKLLAHFEENSPYHQTVRPTFFAALRELLREARGNAKQRRQAMAA